MLSNPLQLLNYNLLIIGALIVFFYSFAFSEETGINLHDKSDFVTLELNSEPAKAQVFIDQEYRGVTPCIVDSLKPGSFNIKLELDGYVQFSETLTLQKGGRKKLIIELQKDKGNLQISSYPEGALIIIEKDTIGKTPYSFDIKQGSYNLILTKPDFFNLKRTITIPLQDTTRISEELKSKKKFRNFRKVAFGSLAIGFGSLGAYMHFNKLEKAHSAEEKAWDDYMQINLDPSEYDKLYTIYKRKANETNKIKNRRNAYFSVAGISCVGFSFSFRF